MVDMDLAQRVTGCGRSQQRLAGNEQPVEVNFRVGAAGQREGVTKDERWAMPVGSPYLDALTGIDVDAKRFFVASAVGNFDHALATECRERRLDRRKCGDVRIGCGRHLE